MPSLSPGTYDVVAEVYGKAARTSVRIESARTPNRAPSVSFVSSLPSSQLRVGTTQTFTAEARDPDENLTRVEWFVNGQTIHGESLNSVGSARDSLDYRVHRRATFASASRSPTLTEPATRPNGGLRASLLSRHPELTVWVAVLSL